MLFQCISSGFSALQLFLELVKFCLCNPLKLHDVPSPLLAAVHAGHARTQRQGGNSLAFVKRLLPPVLPWQTVEVGLSQCSLLLQKLQVSLSFGVKTLPSPHHAAAQRLCRKKKWQHLAWGQPQRQEESREPRSLLEVLIYSFSVKHINQLSAALRPGWHILFMKRSIFPTKSHSNERGINIQEGTGQTIITLMTYPVGVLCALTLRKKGIKRKEFKPRTERTKIDIGGQIHKV